jgi:proteasome lid subunit RPN8/RPN11
MEVYKLKSGVDLPFPYDVILDSLADLEEARPVDLAIELEKRGYDKPVDGHPKLNHEFNITPYLDELKQAGIIENAGEIVAPEEIEIPRKIYESIIKSAKKSYEEVGHILIGKGYEEEKRIRVTGIVSLDLESETKIDGIATQSVSMDFEDYYWLWRESRALWCGEETYVAFHHSHPHGKPEPGILGGDARRAYELYPMVQLVSGEEGGEWKIKAYTSSGDLFATLVKIKLKVM